MKTRSPAVAGAFYPFSKEAVVAQLRELFSYWNIDLDSLHRRKRVGCRGIVVPHAGWAYSGYVAARVFADVPKSKTIIIMGPNHSGMGPDFSISSDDAWETPLGEVKVDTGLAQKLADTSIAELDDMAHIREHSIEVQLPFLQMVLDDFRIVPLSIKHYAPDAQFLNACRELGRNIADLVARKDSLLVASTDFTHYEPQEMANAKDYRAMEAIERLDEAGLFEVILEDMISMCGYAGVAATIVACKQLGARKGEKVAYMTSGNTTGDMSAVVGYGGLRIL